jgi:hypothetical protein
MAWSPYTNQFGTAAAAHIKGQGDLVDVTEHQENAAGTLTEIEALRGYFGPLSGVISGFEPTEDDVNDEIDIAAGVALCRGLKAVGGVSIALGGEGADTYYGFMDPDEVLEADAYQIKNTIPDDDELLLCRFDWDGVNTITNFVDLRQKGVLLGHIVWSTPAYDTALSGYDTEVVYSFFTPFPICLRRPSVQIVDCGSGAGPTIYDVKVGTFGATASIWASGAATSGLSVAHDATDGAIVRSLDVPDQNFDVSANTLVEIYQTQSATSATGARVVIPYTYRIV